MGFSDASRVEEAEDRVGEGVEGAVADVLGRFPVSGQVEGVDDLGLGEGFLDEQPGVLVAAEAVDQNDVVAFGAQGRVGELASVDLDEAGDRAFRLFYCSGVDLRAGLPGGFVEFAVRRRAGGDQRDGSADGHFLPSGGDDAPENAVARGFEGAVDLVGVDVGEVVTGLDLVSFGHEPVGDPAAFHREAPLGHRDPLDHRRYSTTAFAALTTFCASGM